MSKKYEEYDLVSTKYDLEEKEVKHFTFDDLFFFPTVGDLCYNAKIHAQSHKILKSLGLLGTDHSNLSKFKQRVFIVFEHDAYDLSKYNDYQKLQNTVSAFSNLPKEDVRQIESELWQSHMLAIDLVLANTRKYKAKTQSNNEPSCNCSSIFSCLLSSKEKKNNNPDR